jgi:hypothetical protein
MTRTTTNALKTRMVMISKFETDCGCLNTRTSRITLTRQRKPFKISILLLDISFSPEF